MARPRPVADPDKIRRILARRFDLPPERAELIPGGTLDVMAQAAAQLAAGSDGSESGPVASPRELAAEALSRHNRLDSQVLGDRLHRNAVRQDAEEAERRAHIDAALAETPPPARRPQRPAPLRESDAERRLRVAERLTDVIGPSELRDRELARLAQAVTDESNNDPRGGNAA